MVFFFRWGNVCWLFGEWVFIFFLKFGKIMFVFDFFFLWVDDFGFLVKGFEIVFVLLVFIVLLKNFCL